MNGLAYFLPRGGQDFIDTDYIDCGIEEGLHFLDNKRVRKIILDLYRHKRKGKIIYITATAVCHIANQYGVMFSALPFAMGDFGLTSIYQTIRKVSIGVLLGSVGPLWFIGGRSALVSAFLLAILGLRMAFTNLDLLETSPIHIMGSIKNLNPRIPASNDVVVVNFRNKIIMNNPVQENQECWLHDQAFLNPKCSIKPTEIPSIIELVPSGLKYGEVVNMQDVTGLSRVKFTDIVELGQVEPSIIQSGKGKTVDFLDKFGDSGIINEMDKWDISESSVPQKNYLRTKNNL